MMFQPEPLPEGLNEEEKEEILEIRANGRKNLQKMTVEHMDFKRSLLDLDEGREQLLFVELNTAFSKERNSYQNLMRMAESDDFNSAQQLILRSKAEHHQSVAWGIAKAAEAVGIDLLGVREEV